MTGPVSAHRAAKAIDVDAIPVIDVGGLASGSEAEVAAQMLAAAQGTGFVYIRTHGVAPALIELVFALGRRFFAADQAAKDRYAVNRWHRGFIRQGEATMYKGARPDLKESFIWGLEEGGLEQGAGDRPNAHGIPPNQWPAFAPAMREALNAYFGAVHQVGWGLMRAFAVGLGVDAGTFVRSIDHPTSRGSLVWYPPQPPDQTPEAGTEQYGVAPHTDWGCLTLLCQDNTGGLEVQGRDGVWVTAHPIEGTYVVNVGDLLARWTNDRFKSTPHRVVNRSGRERLSCAMFVDPNRDTVVAPVVGPGAVARHAPVTCGDYVQSRLDEAFAYRKKPSV